MKNDSDTLRVKKKKYPTKLQILTSTYAFLYLLFIVGNITENTAPYNAEYIVVNLLFVLFLVGYFFSWKNERIAGLLFIFWWLGMWYLGLFVVETDRGAGVVMGLPLFILGILFIVSWYRKRLVKE
jgi:hypothetical protein